MITSIEKNTGKIKPRYEGRRVTREEYLDLPEDGFQYDMIEGVLHMSPSAYFEHGFAAASFFGILKSWVIGKGAGYITIETDIFLPDGGDVLRPDISFILEKNKHIIIGHIHGTPDLVCEVLPDSTKERDIGAKAARYLSNGVKEYWILNPAEKSIHVWLNRASVRDKKTAALLHSELLPGLQISANDIYTGMPE